MLVNYVVIEMNEILNVQTSIYFDCKIGQMIYVFTTIALQQSFVQII